MEIPWIIPNFPHHQYNNRQRYIKAFVLKDDGKTGPELYRTYADACNKSSYISKSLLMKEGDDEWKILLSEKAGVNKYIKALKGFESKLTEHINRMIGIRSMAHDAIEVAEDHAENIKG